MTYDVGLHQASEHENGTNNAGGLTRWTLDPVSQSASVAKHQTQSCMKKSRGLRMNGCCGNTSVPGWVCRPPLPLQPDRGAGFTSGPASFSKNPLIRWF